MEKLLMSKLRPATEDDEKYLPIMSYSAFDVFKKCQLGFKFKYIDKKRDKDVKTLALEIGTLTHRVLEEKGKMIISSNKVNYEVLSDMLENGIENEEIIGVNGLKKKYYEEWFKVDDKTNMNYTHKVELFKEQILPNEIGTKCDKWQPKALEKEFKFVYDNRVIIFGYIDRVDEYIDENGEPHYGVVDYKSSKKIFEEKDTKTALQMFIYALAVLYIYGKLPEMFLYRFILIDQKQEAMTAGWVNRGIKSLDNLIDKIELDKKTNVWKPTPNQLCYWCDYCKNNPNAKKYKNECQYYSLWTPQNKTFQKNKEWSAEDVTAKRRLIF